VSDNFVTVATFNKTFEAQMAKNLLENEGIASMMSGAISSDMFGSLAAGDQIVLQVREEDAQRATGVLAVAAAEARLDDDWEEQAESGVWICSICGEPISNRLSICYSCQTPKEGIRSVAPREGSAIQGSKSLPSLSDTLKEIPTPSTSADESLSTPQEDEEAKIQEEPRGRGDDFARRAFLATLAAMVVPVLLPIAWFMLMRAAWVAQGTSAKGYRYFYAALLLNLLAASILYYLCSGLRFRF
jgi:hypothetical protein